MISRLNPAISLQNAKDHLRVTHNLEDDLITAIAEASVEWAEEYTGMSFSDVEVVATTELQLTEYRLARYSPITTVQVVTDANNDNVNFTFKFPNIVQLDDEMTEDQYPLTIAFTSDGSVNTPQPARMAMLLKVSDLYDYRADRHIPINREGQARRVSEELLQPYKTIQFSP